MFSLTDLWLYVCPLKGYSFAFVCNGNRQTNDVNQQVEGIGLLVHMLTCSFVLLLILLTASTGVLKTILMAKTGKTVELNLDETRFRE